MTPTHIGRSTIQEPIMDDTTPETLAKLLAEATEGPWQVKRLPSYPDQIEDDTGFAIANVEMPMLAEVGGYCTSPKQRRPRPGEVEANAELMRLAWSLAAQRIADAATIERMTKVLGPCLTMLEALVKESGRNVEWGEEDGFRMGEWFEAEDLAAIEAARAALKGAKP